MDSELLAVGSRREATVMWDGNWAKLFRYKQYQSVCLLGQKAVLGLLLAEVAWVLLTVL